MGFWNRSCLSILQTQIRRQRSFVLQMPLHQQNLEIIMALCLVPNVPDDWELLISWAIKNLKGRSFRASICKVAWWAMVYHIWIERNSRIYDDNVRTEEHLIKDIRRDVKARLESAKGRDNILHRVLCNNWKYIFVTFSLMF
jgi:hypothetical protein